MWEQRFNCSLDWSLYGCAFACHTFSVPKQGQVFVDGHFCHYLTEKWSCSWDKITELHVLWFFKIQNFNELSFLILLKVYGKIAGGSSQRDGVFFGENFLYLFGQIKKLDGVKDDFFKAFHLVFVQIQHFVMIDELFVHTINLERYFYVPNQWINFTNSEDFVNF